MFHATCYMITLDGQKIANEIKGDLSKKISESGKQPGLAGILVGNDPASEIYINLKKKACGEVGIDFHSYLCNDRCYDDINEAKLIELIKFLNNDAGVDGILVQLPLPKEYNTEKVISAMNPKKMRTAFILKEKKTKLFRRPLPL